MYHVIILWMNKYFFILSTCAWHFAGCYPHKMFSIIKLCYEGNSLAPKLIMQITYLLAFFSFDGNGCVFSLNKARQSSFLSLPLEMPPASTAVQNGWLCFHFISLLEFFNNTL